MLIPLLAGRGGRAEPWGHSRCWPLSLRGVSEHYASLPSCLLLAGDGLGQSPAAAQPGLAPVGGPVCGQMLKRDICGVPVSEGFGCDGSGELVVAGS